jgi:recombination protein RecT
MEQNLPKKDVVTVSPRTALIRTVEANLSTLLQSQAEALPKGFNQTRFLQNCLAVLNDTKDIENCTPVSIARTMIKGAYLGLDFFRKECYAIPYDGRLQFQTDYKGEVKIISKHSVKKIQDIYAKLVRVGDDLVMGVRDGRQSLSFNPLNFNDGELQGAFAVVYFEDGSMSCDAMSIKEIEAVRNSYSKAPKSPAWIKSYGEMCKKTVLRRLCKMISLEFDNLEQAKAFDDGADATFEKPSAKEKPKVDDPFAANAPVDVSATPDIIAAAKIGLEYIESEEGFDTSDSEFVKKAIENSEKDAHMRREFKELHPTYEDWQIDALIKERKGL